MQEEGNRKEGAEDRGFSLPDGYFSVSARKILDKAAWEQEMEKYPRLFSLRDDSVFGIPEKYFEQQELRLELLPFERLAALEKTKAFLKNPLPLNEENGKGLLNLLHRDQSRLFTVPQDYFINSSTALVNDMLSENPARIIPLRRMAFMWAAAAAVLLSLGLWIYPAIVPVNSPVQDCETIACVDRKELMEAARLEGLDDAELLEMVNYKELERSLNGHSKITPGETDSSSGFTEDELLDNI